MLLGWAIRDGLVAARAYHMLMSYNRLFLVSEDVLYASVVFFLKSIHMYM